MSYDPIDSKDPDKIELKQGSGYSPPQEPPPNPTFDPTAKKEGFSQHVTFMKKEWPDRPQHVARFTPLRSAILVWDVIFASTPLIFIVLAILAARQDDKQSSEYLTKLKRALLLSPTIFPIIFAALMGQCFRQIGLYRAERGIELGRLEQLVGAQSLVSSLERQFRIRSWSISGLLMTLIWLLSPLGGQSALRLFDGGKNFAYGNATFGYLSPLASMDTNLQGASPARTERPTYLAIFLSAIISAPRFQMTNKDLWGNPRIPLFRTLSGQPDVHGWKNVAGGRAGNGLPLGQLRAPASPKSDLTYASLIGVPIILPERKVDESSFSLKTRVWDVNCSEVRVAKREWPIYGNTWLLNYTNGEDRCTGGYPCKIRLESLQKDMDNVTVAACEVTYQYLEVELWCQATECETARMRTLPLLNDEYGPRSDNDTRRIHMFNLMWNLPSLEEGQGSPQQSSNAEKWMDDPSNVVDRSEGWSDLSKLDPALFGERLTAIWNTFFQSTYATRVLRGNLPKNSTAYTPYLKFNETLGATAEKQDVSMVNWRWLVALLICAVILQVAAIVGLVLKYLSLAPNIIGYASSLTLMNPYIRIPTGGTTLDGLERAALLSRLRVKIGDVCPDEPVGVIALAAADDERVGQLDRNKLYK